MAAELPDELAAAIRGRDRWSGEGRTAVYTPPEGTHTVRVQRFARPARRAEEWAASLIVGGDAQRSTTAYTATEAVRWAETVKPTT